LSEALSGDFTVFGTYFNSSRISVKLFRGDHSSTRARKIYKCNKAKVGIAFIKEAIWIIYNGKTLLKNAPKLEEQSGSGIMNCETNILLGSRAIRIYG